MGAILGLCQNKSEFLKNTISFPLFTDVARSCILVGVTKQTVDHNLINFETQSNADVSGGGDGVDGAVVAGGTGGEAVQFDDDEFIFEEFTRMRLKGASAEDAEA